AVARPRQTGRPDEQDVPRADRQHGLWDVTGAGVEDLVRLTAVLRQQQLTGRVEDVAVVRAQERDVADVLRRRRVGLLPGHPAMARRASGPVLAGGARSAPAG